MIQLDGFLLVQKDNSGDKVKSVGIIAEYDPFHNGHKYQIKKAREETKADVVIVVMSSNFTQRGEPAIFDKWTRTRMALENGVDMVIELPIQSAVQPANIFAKKAVELIESLNCDFIAFGAEHSETDFFELSKKELSLNDEDLMEDNNNFASNYQKLFFKKFGVDLSYPNDNLAYWYAVAIRKISSKLKMVPIQRIESNHGDLVLGKNISSGKSIRLALMNHQIINHMVPKTSINLKKLKPIYWNDYFPFLKFKILTASIFDLQKIYQMTEGLEYKLKKEIVNANTFVEFMNKIKSKRYTYTRLQRLLVYVLFSITEDEINSVNSSIRILGFNNSGKCFLNENKKKIELPIFTKTTKKMIEENIPIEFKSGQIVEMINGQTQDLFKYPIIIKN
ncbi:nucleotidyltransferase [Lactobacillus sp. S2-2]|uniref:nucleotidyltransferase n=1 Tax=Lactobacillus sp. S2-2 TaxID=2692917 RepID=UPI001F484EC8|nr:nucleotidyltransferase [Lactobacillus sp. S2-2]